MQKLCILLLCTWCVPLETEAYKVSYEDNMGLHSNNMPRQFFTFYFSTTQRKLLTLAFIIIPSKTNNNTYTV